MSISIVLIESFGQTITKIEKGVGTILLKDASDNIIHSLPENGIILEPTASNSNYIYIMPKTFSRNSTDVKIPINITTLTEPAGSWTQQTLIAELLTNFIGRATGDVFVQDQTTTSVDYFFSKGTGAPTSLATDASLNDTLVKVVSASGCSLGDYVGLFNTEGDRAYFGEITSISNDTIGLDTPLDFDFKTNDVFACFTRDLNVDGSSTSQTFSIQVGSGSQSSIDITRIMISMTTVNPPLISQFGDQPSLTRGLVLRKTDGETFNLWNLKSNLEIANMTFDTQTYLQTNPSQDVNGFSARNTYGGQDKHGVVIRLEPGDRLDLIVQDDLSGLLQMRVIAQGHFVD